LKSLDPGFCARALDRVLREHLDRPDLSLKVAFSGGVDSHVLLHALCELRSGSSWRVSAVHIDHGLQPRSAEWATHCQQVCEALGVSCTVERIEVIDRLALGHEGAARHARYARLARHIGAQDILLTAHHLDDQAETVLLQLLRGAGLRGLAGMPVSAPFAGGKLIRPLLGFTRAQLHAYAQAHNLCWIEDTSNRNLRYARNFVRQRLLPLAEQRWPQARPILARTSRHAAEADRLLDELAQEDLERARLEGNALSIARLQGLSAARRCNALRCWIRQSGFRAPSALLLERIERMVREPTRTARAAVRWSAAEVRRYRDRLSVTALADPPDMNLRLSWNPDEALEIPGTNYVLRAQETVGSGLARAKLAGKRLTVRLRQGGERLQLPGRLHHHKLKKLLQEAGVAPWERTRLPLIYADEQLAAVADRWVCAAFAARAGEAALQVVLEQAKKPDVHAPVV
jgi:tRNA(Ile)-lysidine synthase